MDIDIINDRALLIESVYAFPRDNESEVRSYRNRGSLQSRLIVVMTSEHSQEPDVEV